MKVGIKLIPIILGLVAIGWLILRNSETHAPVREGSAIEFWRVAFGVNVGDDDDPGFWGGFYPPKGDLGIYYVQGYHDQFLRTVPLSDLAPLLPKVIQQIKLKRQTDELPQYFDKVLDSVGDGGTQPGDVRRFLSETRRFNLESLREENPKRHDYWLESEKAFDERWRRASYYKLTLLFEFTWLGGLVVLAGIPWLRRGGALTWSIVVAAIPPLLFLPLFLGYVPFVYTSAFPGGGVVYPYALIWFRSLPWTDFDTRIMKLAPTPFEPLNQAPGPMLAVTGTGGPGPVSIFALGLVLGITVYGSVWLFRSLRSLFRSMSWKQRGWVILFTGTLCMAGLGVWRYHKAMMVPPMIRRMRSRGIVVSYSIYNGSLSDVIREDERIGSLTFSRIDDLSPITKHVDRLTALRSIEFSSTKVVSLKPLADFRNLEQVRFAHTKVRDLSPLAKLSNLKYVVCGNSRVVDVSPLSDLQKLVGLDLMETPVRDVSPLGNLRSLTWLNLPEVEEVAPLANAPMLRHLRLTVKPDMNLSQLGNLNQLRTLELHGASSDQLEMLQGLLPNCVVSGKWSGSWRRGR